MSEEIKENDIPEQLLVKPEVLERKAPLLSEQPVEKNR